MILRFGDLIGDRKIDDKAIKKRNRKQTCIRERFLIDFWSILDRFWDHFGFQNRFRNSIENEQAKKSPEISQGSALDAEWQASNFRDVSNFGAPGPP